MVGSLTKSVSESVEEGVPMNNCRWDAMPFIPVLVFLLTGGWTGVSLIVQRNLIALCYDEAQKYARECPGRENFSGPLSLHLFTTTASGTGPQTDSYRRSFQWTTTTSMPNRIEELGRWVIVIMN